MNKTLLLLLTLLFIITAVGVSLAADQKAVCAYDGMVMNKSAMKASVDYYGETLYFCSTGEKEKFMKDPAKYRRAVDIDGNKVVINFMPAAEYQAAMKNMGMEMDHPMKGNYHIGVTVFDKGGNLVKNPSLKLTLTDSKKKARSVSLMPMMGSLMGATELSPGKYSGEVQLNGKKAGFTYNAK